MEIGEVSIGEKEFCSEINSSALRTLVNDRLSLCEWQPLVDECGFHLAVLVFMYVRRQESITKQCAYSMQFLYCRRYESQRFSD